MSHIIAFKNLILNFLNRALMGKAFVFSKSQLSSHHLLNFVCDFLLLKSKGVLHIGAYDGLAFGKKYSEFNKPVIWIEANADIFPTLERNVSSYPNQRAINVALGSSCKTRHFFSATNLGSSSLFPLREDNIFGLSMTSSRPVRTKTLESLFKKNSLLGFDYWVIDTQGAELEILKGAGRNLTEFCRYLVIEVSVDNQYIGGAEFQDVKAFLDDHGFIALWEFVGGHGDMIFVNPKMFK